jgi:hypothetical protein
MFGFSDKHSQLFEPACSMICPSPEHAILTSALEDAFIHADLMRVHRKRNF